jgi:hypothetical protein
MKHLVWVVGVALIGTAFWLGTVMAPTRYQLLEHQGVVVRLEQRTGQMEMFIARRGLDGQMAIMSVEQAQREDAEARAIRHGIEAETLRKIAPCLKRGKSRLDCEWAMYVSGETTKR